METAAFRLTGPAVAVARRPPKPAERMPSGSVDRRMAGVVSWFSQI